MGLANYFIPLFFLLLLTPTVLADFYDGGVLVKETCVNDTHVQLTYEYNDTDEGATVTSNYHEQVHECTFNCSSITNTCRDVGESDLTGQILLTGGIAFLFMWLGTSFNKQHAPMQMLFTFIGLILILNTAGLIYQSANFANAGPNVLDLLSNQLWVLAITFLIFASYFMIGFLHRVLMSVELG